MGLVFGYLVLETGSIFAGMVGHIVNNGFAVTLGYILNLAADFIPGTDAAGEMAVDMSVSLAMLVSTIMFGIISVITLSIAYQLMKIIKRDREKSNLEIYDKVEETDVKKAEFIPLIFTGILFIIVIVIQIREIISLG